MLSCDVLVVGGGPAGCSAAVHLARSALSVVLIEKSRYERWRAGETLPPAIRAPLAELGASFILSACPQVPSNLVRSAWDTAEPHDQDFIFNPYGSGFHVDRRRFDRMLAAHARSQGVRVILQSKFDRAESAAGQHWPEGWIVHASSGDRIRRFSARFLLDASGRNAVIARALGARGAVYDRLIAAVARFRFGDPSPWTLIEAAQEGWWYSAPLPAGRFVAAFMTDADIWARDKEDPKRWLNHLQNAPLTRERLGAAAAGHKLRLLSASSVLRLPASGPRWIAVGDAVAAFDPLSGQGVYAALVSGQRAAAAVNEALRDNSAAAAPLDRIYSETYARYLETKTNFYRRVRRFPDSPFWTRRFNS